MPILETLAPAAVSTPGGHRPINLEVIPPDEIVIMNLFRKTLEGRSGAPQAGMPAATFPTPLKPGV